MLKRAEQVQIQEYKTHAYKTLKTAGVQAILLTHPTELGLLLFVFSVSCISGKLTVGCPCFSVSFISGELTVGCSCFFCQLYLRRVNCWLLLFFCQFYFRRANCWLLLCFFLCQLYLRRANCWLLLFFSVSCISGELTVGCSCFFLSVVSPES